MIWAIEYKAGNGRWVLYAPKGCQVQLFSDKQSVWEYIEWRTSCLSCSTKRWKNIVAPTARPVQVEIKRKETK